MFNGVTTGTPISLFIENKDVKSKDYDEIKLKINLDLDMLTSLIILNMELGITEVVVEPLPEKLQ